MSIKLSQYAKLKGVHYKTAHRWWKAGKLEAYQFDTGTVIVRDEITHPKGIALYARVSSADQKADLTLVNAIVNAAPHKSNSVLKP